MNDPTWISVLPPVLAIVLAIANSKLKVFEDPRIDVVADMLPGSNCGACGYPGCRGFSEKVVNGEVQPSGCPVGGADTAAIIADFLGVDAGEALKKTARLLCAGGDDVAEGYKAAGARCGVRVAQGHLDLYTERFLKHCAQPG